MHVHHRTENSLKWEESIFPAYQSIQIVINNAQTIPNAIRCISEHSELMAVKIRVGMELIVRQTKQKKEMKFDTKTI